MELRPKKLVKDAAALVALLAFSLLVCRHLLGGLNSRLPLSGFSGDDGLGVWWMAWLPFALGHGLNPFVSHYQAAPKGMNVLSNPSTLFPSLLLSPVTVACGPVTAFNVALMAAPVISGGSLYFVGRRLRLSPLGSFVASALYGFSPYLMHESQFGHFNLTWLYFPPLAYYLSRQILLQFGNPYRAGFVLGGLVVAQYFTSTEVLLDCVLVGLLMTIIYVARHAREWRAVLANGLKGLGAALAVCAPLLAYPLVFAFAGPYHVLPIQKVNAGIAITSPAWPSAITFFPTGFFGHADSGFLGPVAVLVAFAAHFWKKRVREVIHFTTGAIVAFIFALGATVGTYRSTIIHWAPMAWLDHWSLIRAIQDYRLSAIMVMFVALLCGVTLTELARVAPSWWHEKPWWPLTFSTAVGAGVLVMPLLADNFPEAVQQVSLPPAIAAAIRPGTPSPTLETYPEVSLLDGSPLIWQALSGMAFHLTSGYAFVPGPHGSVVPSPPQGTVGGVFSAELAGRLGPEVSQGVLRAMTGELTRDDVTGVVVYLAAPGGRQTERLLRRILGPPTYRSSDFAAWNDVMSVDRHES